MIEQQFNKIFNENAGLSTWFSKSSDLIGTASTESSDDTPRRVDPVTLFRSVRSFNPGSSMSLRNNIISVDRVIALHQLAHQCYDSLSSLSKQGHKGALLNNLLKKIDQHKPQFNEEQYKRAVLELVNITASYRPTYFFQAAYGQTRSAKVLINAIKNTRLNEVLPIASIIFNTPDIDYSKQSDETIVDLLQSLRRDKRWSESSHAIGALSSLDGP